VHWWIAERDARLAGDAKRLEDISAEIDAHNAPIERMMNALASGLRMNK
jgi:hypothetical protein